MLRFFCFLAFNLACSLYAQKLRVYALAGQGSDCRIFDSLKLQEEVDFHCLTYSIPPKAARMEDYARILSAQIDTSNPFVLLGVSLGGMLACEMSEFLNPEQVVIISSAKGKKELPGRYRIFRKIPIYRLIPGTFFKWSAFVLQPIVEPDRNSRKELFVSMLRAKEALFLKRSIPMIVEWDKTSSC
jgi:alpha-beta hydrolase superfamily lysophospholipase